jgi:hypothetical protein
MQTSLPVPHPLSPTKAARPHPRPKLPNQSSRDIIDHFKSSNSCPQLTTTRHSLQSHATKQHNRHTSHFSTTTLHQNVLLRHGRTPANLVGTENRTGGGGDRHGVGYVQSVCTFSRVHRSGFSNCLGATGCTCCAILTFLATWTRRPSFIGCLLCFFGTLALFVNTC